MYAQPHSLSGSEVRRFNFFVPITKATRDDDGNWTVKGPLSEPGADFQGETMDMAGLRKGLEAYKVLGRNVDWEHLYRQTKNLKWVIGKGLDIYDAPHPKTGKIVPWMDTRLLKSKEAAQEVIKHLKAIEEEGLDGEVGLGYSVEGGAIQKSGTHIVEPIITMVTMTPQPVVGANAGTISRCAKGLDAIVKGLSSFAAADLITVPDMVCPISDEAFERDLEAVLKAMTATGSLPHAGPGISAAEVEDLGGKGRKHLAGHCPVCDRPGDDCRCEMLKKAFAYQLSEELADLLAA